MTKILLTLSVIVSALGVNMMMSQPVQASGTVLPPPPPPPPLDCEGKDKDHEDCKKDGG